MGYSIGWDSDNNRWKGYGVPCICEHPECNAEIDRGMSYLCQSCGTAICGAHMGGETCERCYSEVEPWPAKPEHPEWLQHLRTDVSWSKWRATPENMAQLERWERAAIAAQANGERNA